VQVKHFVVLVGLLDELLQGLDLLGLDEPDLPQTTMKSSAAVGLISDFSLVLVSTFWVRSVF
jgi:hypothetical protein